MQQLNRGVHIKLGLFATVALLATSYLGAAHVGLSPFTDGDQVSVSLPDAGGLFVNSEVTYRGVQVGEVTAMEPTKDGVEVQIQLEADAPDIPADSTVRVRNRSAIGEQFLDIIGTNGTDYLADGDRMAGGPDALPQDLNEVLRSSRDLVNSIPSDDLTTVIDESYDLSRGLGDDMTRLLKTSMDFQRAADANFLVTASLIRNAGRVLATQEESGAAIRSFSNDLSLFAATLADSDADLRTLIANTPGATRQVSLLISDVGQPLAILMNNLVSTATIIGVNSDGVRDAMIRLPEAVSIGWAATGSKGLAFGMVPTFFNPIPCVEGYNGTTRRRGTDASDGPPLNKSAGCTAPRSEGNVRGPRALPSTSGANVSGRLTDIDMADGLDDLMGGDR